MRAFLTAARYACFVVLLCETSVLANDSDPKKAEDVFNQRIMPIFRSPEPSSCIQCHLSSVDLKEYILPSHEETFLSLRDQGLIDVETPTDSKILKLIQLGETDLDEGAKLIHEKLRQQEFEAFANWIEASCADTELVNRSPLSPSQLARPAKPDEVIRHTRRSSLAESFAKTVWTHRMRCFPCHTPFEIDESNPRHQAVIKKQREFAEKHPELVDRLDLFQRTPEQTIDELVRRSRQTEPGDYPMLNLEAPTKSLLVLKPMSKLPAKIGENELGPPSSSDPVSHYGGLKLHPNDQTYKAIIKWIDDYAQAVHGDYKIVSDLPQDLWIGTQQVVRLTNIPESWPVGETVQIFIHTWDEEHQMASDEPVAFTQGTVTPRHLVNGTLLVIAPRESASETTAPNPFTPGRFVVKVYRDQQGKIHDEPTLLLDETDLVGTTELDQPKWREGFRFAEQIDASLLK
ncbi:hypothetical protein KOR42_42180 [Thalassoglobus neptunius]|uniref:Cytochrome c domain-containing protein n=1 Tax=Thalassoglobus neptunius TaxID=1938619 RepID=A0A5C5W916_9PLAN|nr:hypothetical protein [Thalassoglobus neptunius]TWT47104.1 hypothetical protein KOR42_42180 [Thalassoglobus neptunius]